LSYIFDFGFGILDLGFCPPASPPAARRAGPEDSSALAEASRYRAGISDCKNGVTKKCDNHYLSKQRLGIFDFRLRILDWGMCLVLDGEKRSDFGN